MSLSDGHIALDRTGLLLATDVHDGQVSQADAICGLLATRTEVRATEAELGSPAAQHAVVTLVLHLAMCGIGIHLDLPDVELVAPQPPLVGSHLRSALERHLESTFGWLTLQPVEHPDVRFLIGATPAVAPTDVRVTGDLQGIAVGVCTDIEPRPWAGAWPIAPVAAGIAAASYAVRTASTRTAAQLGIRPPTLPTGVTRVTFDPTIGGQLDLGVVPIVSAGAITHGALFVLLRVPGLRCHLRPYDDDFFEGTNLNRYLLMRATQIGMAKATSLDHLSTERFCVSGVPTRYTGGEAAGCARMLIGADDIRVRWTAQNDVDGWLGIGATSHLFAQVSTHLSGEPCAGCVHDHEDEAPETIPTISVISGWAGLHLADQTLLSSEHQLKGQSISSFPLGLPGRHGEMRGPTRPNPRCPRHCAASRSVA